MTPRRRFIESFGKQMLLDDGTVMEPFTGETMSSALFGSFFVNDLEQYDSLPRAMRDEVKETGNLPMFFFGSER